MVENVSKKPVEVKIHFNAKYKIQAKKKKSEIVTKNVLIKTLIKKMMVKNQIIGNLIGNKIGHGVIGNKFQ